ncbi:MAG TPA: hypothetical protein DCF33_12915, partial [Saprospirales bacterium]|nr:hypothetical protein [Saprospirales bacterium]
FSFIAPLEAEYNVYLLHKIRLNAKVGNGSEGKPFQSLQISFYINNLSKAKVLPVVALLKFYT